MFSFIYSMLSKTYVKRKHICSAYVFSNILFFLNNIDFRFRSCFFYRSAISSLYSTIYSPIFAMGSYIKFNTLFSMTTLESTSLIVQRRFVIRINCDIGTYFSRSFLTSCFLLFPRKWETI